MTERSPDPHAIDLSTFCRRGLSTAGSWPLMALRRLSASFSAASDGELAWSARGSLLTAAGAEAQLWLELDAATVVPLQCQRCLQTLAEPLRVERRIRFVATEEEAEQLDEVSEDDVLVQPGRLDLHALLEDELILALPLVPRHTVCPEPLPLPVAAAEPSDVETPAHPFAALAALRKR